MMIIEYDESLVETVVFDEIAERERAGELRLARMYARDREEIYAEESGPKRDALARRCHEGWFVRLELHRIPSAAAGQIGFRPSRLLIVAARSARDEGADLYSKQTQHDSTQQKTIVLRIQSSRWRDPEALAAFTRHELQLIADLWRPGFGVDPTTPPVGLGSLGNRIRDRYRVLWEISADGRIESRGMRPLLGKLEWEHALARTFSSLDAVGQAQLFKRFYGSAPTHHELLAAAREGLTHLEAAGQGPEPGGRCPLCNMTTFDWQVAAADLPDRVVARIHRAFPAWRPDSGACRECCDRYRVLVNM